MTVEADNPLSFPIAARFIRRNKTTLRAVALVAFVCLSIIFGTIGMYFRNWQMQFKIQELKDYILISNQPDSACKGNTVGEWVYGAIERFMGCDARQREDFTRSDKEIYDQCITTHTPGEKIKNCQRGKELQFFVFNVTNPQEVVEGLTPKIVEVGRKGDGGPLVFYEDCKTFDTEFGPSEAEFSEYCYYTYKYPGTEGVDLGQELVTVNFGLMEAIGNSVGKIDYIIPIVWGTLGLDYLNATTTAAQDYMRGQLLAFSWPDDFGAHFLNELSPAMDRAGFKARDNARKLYEMVLDPVRDTCIVNGTQYDRNQCISMANTLAIYARRYYESFQTYKIHPYNLKYKEGAGLFVRTQIGDLLGYYSGHDDILSSYYFPKKISWNVVRSRTQVEVSALVRAGMADSQNGILNPGPLGRSKVVSNTIRNLGEYTKYEGRTHITEFDWPGCRPIGASGQVVVPPDGPYPPQCNGGKPQKVSGSRGTQVKPRLWSVQAGIDEATEIHVFSKTLMRSLKFSAVEEIELEAGDDSYVHAKMFELQTDGLQAARMEFNCEEIYKDMAAAGVLNRGSDCDLAVGMFDLSAANNFIPLIWSLPHFYLVTASDSLQHPLNNLVGLVTPGGSRYRSMMAVEPESGRALQTMFKEQISVRLYHHSANYFFTQHKPVIIPLYWKFETKNATMAERQLLGGFQSTFQGLNAGFIVCVVVGAICLVIALSFGMLLYHENSLQTVDDKRKKIQEELVAGLPDNEGDDDQADQTDQEFM